MIAKQFPALLALTLSGGLALCTAAPAETLQDAIKTVLSTNPDVRSAAHNRLARDEEVRQARAGYFPTLDVQGGAGKDYVDKPIDADLDPTLVQVSVRQNLFAGLATTNEVDRQKARVESQSYLVRSTANNTALKASDVYLEVLKNQAVVALAKENLTLHERIADQIKLRSESGVDSRADMDQIQSRLNLAHSNLIIAQQNLFDAQTNFNAVIGSPPQQLVRPTLPNRPLPASLEEAEQLAIAAHPQLKSANADLQARREQEEVARSPFMPRVDLEADKTYQQENSYGSGYDGYEEEDLRVFVRVRYNLFNGWKDEARKQETVHLVNEAQEIRNHTHRQVVESIRLSWQAFEASKQKLAFIKKRLQFAASTAQAYTKQWNIGQRTLLDVLDAEAERIDSARQLVTAEYEELYAQYRILNGLGQLIPALQLQYPKEGSVDENELPAKGEPVSQSSDHISVGQLAVR